MSSTRHTPHTEKCDHGRPFISFLTTAYRTEKTLDRTIGSVFAQTRSDWELVIVDNGMSDALAAVVEPHLGDPRVCLLRQQNNGPAGGVMAAAAGARGRYVAVLNSDDAITPDFCEVMAGRLSADASIAAVTCDAYLVEEGGRGRLRRTYLRNAGLRHPPDGDRPLRVAEIIEGPCPYYTAAIRRDVWDAMGGMRTDVPKVHDLDFWLRTIGAGHDVRMIPDRLCVYYLARGSESRPIDPLESDVFEEDRESALVRAAVSTGSRENLEALQRARRRLHYMQALRRARVALLSGDTSLALEESRRARQARSTWRARMLVLGVRVAPSWMARLHPVKQTLQSRFSAPLRRPFPGRKGR